ncbi:cell wall-associated NlpC family hydrolase [Methylohalomonas lacus]|uniref:Cell wall-associated NlpC family hydrolase n=1 Tax=Methylohalomonas lacus TaxID=398773 RepID=A0AAE3HKQ4_9GAMM|nr:NlpC/P60 family protein [Methylohalomonas lacus]MCS3902737.1 cell wall-associated NlpC family hydrolase [Methylohalomonas lacus]
MSLASAVNRNGVVLCLVMFLAACGSTPTRNTPNIAATPSRSEPAKPASADESIKSALYAQYQEWRGTPYRYGGLSKRGIDCSGFVYTTFRKRFDQQLPRTTAGQVRVGYAVPRHAVTAGDLVFFRTGAKGRHVGIYIEDGKFLHASTSAGVMLSNLEDQYWSAHYWKAQRPSEQLAGR